jgi:hypothetical protein
MTASETGALRRVTPDWRSLYRLGAISGLAAVSTVTASSRDQGATVD